MLVSQGWTPGSYLGAVDAPHGHLHSDASSSHIRVALKDDNLGLGAKRGSGQGAGECTGLDVFQGLLGRLNGKNEAVLEKEQKSRDDLKRALYTERKFGALRFVSGGVLVGDRIQKLVEDEKLKVAGKSRSSHDQDPSPASDEETKRSAEGYTETSLNHPKPTEPSHATQAAAPELDASGINTEDQEAATALEQENSGLEKGSDKAKRKAEKAQSRLERRGRKEARRAARAEPHAATRSSCTTSPSDQQSEPQDQPDAEEIRPSSVVLTTAAVSGRHCVRQRYIRQKKLAVMDPKALNEVRELAHSLVDEESC